MTKLKNNSPFLYSDDEKAIVGFKSPDGSETLFAANPSLTRIKNAILNTDVSGPAIAAYSALNVSRGAANGGTVSAGITLASSYGGQAKGILQANALWNRWPSSLDVRFTTWTEVWSQPGNQSSFTYGAPSIHFVHDGQYFESLLTSANPSFTMMVDGKYAYNKYIDHNVVNGVNGATDFFDGLQNCWVKFDFGSRATRRISLYQNSGGGMANFGLASALDSVLPWDRSKEPWAILVTDSLGATNPTKFYTGGFYREALMQLGFADVLINSYGGTGYNITATQTAVANTAYTRIADMAQFQNPDLCLLALGINDDTGNYGGIFSSAAAALAGFTSAVNSTLSTARANGANSVLVVIGPHFGANSNLNFTNPSSGFGWKTKRDIIYARLQSIAGPWIFVDTFLDMVQTSNGYVIGPRGTYVATPASNANPSGAQWWTGTGTTVSPASNGNGDLYSSDGVHPNSAGNDYAGNRLAAMLRTAILAL